MKRHRLIAGNWKMNLDREGSTQLARTLANWLREPTEAEIAIFPPACYLLPVHEALAGSRIALGAQNMYFEASGAFTGELAPAMIRDCGCKYVLAGHSERRHVLGENDEIVNQKVRAALAAGLHPILCVGETLSQREETRTQEVIGNQLRMGLLGVGTEQLRLVTIAYEPCWAIGTGKVATPEQAEEVHAFIRDYLVKSFGGDLAHNITIQYGGSVKADNAEGLMAQPNVDGLLVGGASLKAEDFRRIAQATGT